jgi:hypothetical protein
MHRFIQACAFLFQIFLPTVFHASKIFVFARNYTGICTPVSYLSRAMSPLHEYYLTRHPLPARYFYTEATSVSCLIVLH